jgi:O-Antigen ligase
MMSSKFKFDYKTLFFVAALFGYTGVSIFVTDTSISRLITIPYRAFVLFAACAIIAHKSVLQVFKAKKVIAAQSFRKDIVIDAKQPSYNSLRSRVNKSKGNQLTVLNIIFIFAFVYSLRFVYEGYGKQLFFGDYTYYFSFWFLICLIPGMGFLLIDRNKPTQYLKISYLALFSISILMISKISILKESIGSEQAGRLSGEALNPISLGAFGSTLILISFYLLIVARPKRMVDLLLKLRISHLMLLSCVFSIFSGCYLLISAASRGPIVATLICFLLLLVIAVKKSFPIAISALFSGYAIVSSFILPYIQGEGMANLDRLSSFDDSYEGSRTDLIEASLRLIFENSYNFFVGYGIEIPGYGYPHNILLESFLSTGFFGGCLFSLGCMITLWRSLKLLLSHSPWGWLGLLFIQNMILSLFSGSLYGSSGFWYLLFSVNSLWLSRREDPAIELVPNWRFL